MAPVGVRRELADLEAAALAATRAAALACRSWVGRGRPEAADSAATDAMRRVLAEAPGSGTVVVGEGAKDEAPMLCEGERLGSGSFEFDIAVDPLECTTLCAKGAARVARDDGRGRAWVDGKARLLLLYGQARGSARRRWGDRPDPEPRGGTFSVSERSPDPSSSCRSWCSTSRATRIVERLHGAGARVISPPDGDVAGSLAALLPDGRADLLMGIGGTPEGVMTACAARALGGCMQARLVPQREDEAEALAEAGLSSEHVYEAPTDLVSG